LLQRALFLRLRPAKSPIRRLFMRLILRMPQDAGV